jgi:hypothetical protein
MLDHWNFKDLAPNTSLQQINRQKSARNLQVIQFDPSGPCAIFLDVKRGSRNTASLTPCDCPDFNMSGPSPRKVFKPCMHIYRLAIELGLIDPIYSPADAQFALAPGQALEETQRLQRLVSDASQWGLWQTAVHASAVQKSRQYRAYTIKCLEPDSIRNVGGGWLIHDHLVSLSSCDCMDFRDRKLPCKHIYAAALLSGFVLPFTFTDYETART